MAPKLINLNPERRSFEILPTTPITFEIEGDSQVLKDKLIVFVQGVEAIVGGVYRNDFGGEIKILGKGFSVSIEAPEDFIGFNDEVLIELVVEDENEDILEDKYSYTTVVDVIKPSIIEFEPEDGSKNVDPDVTVKFTVLNERDIVRVLGKTVSVVTSVNEGAPINAIIDGVFQPGFTGTIVESPIGTATSVEVLLSPAVQFESKDEVRVNTFASDAAGNKVEGSFQFTILDFDAPVSEANIKGGLFNKPVRVNLTANEPSFIYYTTDGSTPKIGGPSTFFSQSPIRGIPIFLEGTTQLRFFAVDENDISEVSLDENGAPITPSAVNSETFKISSILPTVSFLNPETGNEFTEEELKIDKRVFNAGYSIDEVSGSSIIKIEVSVNHGAFLDTQSTLLDSSFLFTGLISGENSLRLRAIDEAGNVGIDPETNEIPELIVEVQPAQLYDFSLDFAPLQCPSFSSRSASVRISHSDFVDTKTVVIIGLGRREEILIPKALGEEVTTLNMGEESQQVLIGQDGQPVNFEGTLRDNRHFQVSSFPILEDTLKVFLFRGGREIELYPADFVENEVTGRIVLDHPVGANESLRVTYLSENDINSPELFLPHREDQLFAKHGTPSVENTLSLGAQIAFENGATRIIAIQAMSHEIDPDWSKTFNIGANNNGSLIKEEGYWIVPLPIENREDVIANAVTHIKEASFISRRKERVLVTGEIDNFSRADVSFFSDAEAGKRTLFVTTNSQAEIVRNIGGSIATLNNLFIGAAIAGKFSSFNVLSDPVSKKDLVGFDIIFPNNKSKKVEKYTELERFAEQGLLYVTPLASGGRVFRGTTTIGSLEPITGESSITRVVDFMSKNMRRSLESQFVGSVVTDAVLKSVTDATRELLGQYTTQNLITSFSGIRVVVDSQEPRQVNITFDIVPVFPLNKISFSMGVKVRV